MYDYRESKLRLIDLVREMHQSDWSPTPKSKALEALAKRLCETADLLSESRWTLLEEAFNADPPPATGIDGLPIPLSEHRAGRYRELRYRLYELADFARSEKDRLPNPRERPAVKFAATGLLHIMYQCDFQRPTLYDNSAAVGELEEVCNAASIVLSRERLRGVLSEALSTFDPLMFDSRITAILAHRQ